MKRWILLLLLALTWGCNQTPKPRVIVLGIDGCDPVLLQRFMEEGKLPNFQRLAEQGDFRNLGTSNPPQSPVAWATFTTGLDPGGHGIFDFIHRDPQSMSLVPSMSKLTESGEAVLLRQGQPFWAYLTRAGVPATLLKIAANFPPKGLPGQVLTGMGTPDLEGSYGTFTYYTSAQESPPEDLSGGRFVPVEERDKLIRAALIGPGEDTLPLEISRAEESALIVAGGQSLILNSGEWSDWIPLSFPSGPGMVRFYLKEIRPELKLYASPINIDPCRPLQAVSNPDSFSRHLCRCCGRFYTQGMPEDTKALVHGVLADEEFLQQSDLVIEERHRLFQQGISEFREGLFFFYLSTPDIVSHLYWNTTDPSHPGYTEERAQGFARAIEEAYLEADSFVGAALEASQGDTTLLVLSDHGFAPFYRSFGLNAWLQSQGYLQREGQVTDWSQTQAYGAGFNGLYLNLKGRESQGIVSNAEREALLTQLSEQLLALRDPKNGKAVIRQVYRSEEIYSGDYVEQSPDLVLGYNRGYRASWQTVLGQTEGGLLADNLEPWSGDHLMDPEVVPGVLLCNKPLPAGEAKLIDIAPTILRRFSLDIPAAMKGRDLFQAP